MTNTSDSAITSLTPRIIFFACRDQEGTFLQVDVEMMDVLFTSLVEYLQLENVYNIFILNPKHDVKRHKYGYRCVFWCKLFDFFL